MASEPEDGPEAHTIGVLEELRAAFRDLGANSQELYYRAALRQLSNPNLHDIPSDLSFHIEMWAAMTDTFGGSSPPPAPLRLRGRLTRRPLPRILTSIGVCGSAVT
jgi:hypothetical protein